MKKNVSPLRIAVVTLGLSFAHLANAENRGVIDGPDDCRNVRSEKRTNAESVAKIKIAEPFKFESKEADEWCKVTLASGKIGWVPSTCVRLFFTTNDWPRATPAEIGSSLGYYKVMRRAETGDKQALKK